MILFCDASALIKLYIVDEGREALMTQLGTAEAVAVCRIAWVEAHPHFRGERVKCHRM